ncbi:GTP 3',8-cyclase MoaA [uncultured Cytophaga sp.]|uniref:GTP 3',8-cyclase MoaA n=1 Tax=uncultured Cytophaga sp. TaxID=160238 RepID=UPI0026218C26|nr:GTP 3',8-cyclase MoaA [uncultured Cytophaga sp.]
MHKDLIQDLFGREFKTLRVSLTSLCNMSCVYCVAPGSIHETTNKNKLTTTEYLSIIGKIHAKVGLKTIRLTGGEPLLFSEINLLIKGIVELGITDIKLTTNGLRLLSKIDDLVTAGLRSINISLDALDPTVFKNITNVSNIRLVLDGVDAAVNKGVEVKINTVVLKGINDHQIIPLLEYASSRNIAIRFLELMKMGYLHYNETDHFFSMQEIVDKIASVTSIAKMDRATSNTATYWQTSKGVVFGIIANESEPFCSDCNRLRLDSFGNIYGCISATEGIAINNVEGDGLVDSLNRALHQKQQRFTGSEISMKHIGG